MSLWLVFQQHWGELGTKKSIIHRNTATGKSTERERDRTQLRREKPLQPKASRLTPSLCFLFFFFLPPVSSARLVSSILATRASILKLCRRLQLCRHLFSSGSFKSSLLLLPSSSGWHRHSIYTISLLLPRSLFANGQATQQRRDRRREQRRL